MCESPASVCAEGSFVILVNAAFKTVSPPPVEMLDRCSKARCSLALPTGHHRPCGELQAGGGGAVAGVGGCPRPFAPLSDSHLSARRVEMICAIIGPDCRAKSRAGWNHVSMWGACQAGAAAPENSHLQKNPHNTPCAAT